MWSEEEMRDVEPEPRPARSGAAQAAANVRARITERNAARRLLHPHELTRGASVIYAPRAQQHGNFIDASYRRILVNPAWAARLEKAHTAKRHARATGPEETVRAWRELDTATSSDALLMNIFCYPRVLSTPRLPALLGVERGLEPCFGYRACLPWLGGRQRILQDRTEIDMRLGDLLVEAKLTEADFQTAPLRLVKRYPAFTEVFERELLEADSRGVRSYQLIRGVLAAYAEDAVFCVFVDARRSDLIQAWYAVIGAVRSLRLQSRLRLLTWQEIAAALPQPLRRFLAEKYGISSEDTAISTRERSSSQRGRAT